jgi:TPR repeat protein
MRGKEVERNYEISYKFFMLSSNANSFYHLGFFHQCGIYVPKNLNNALKYYFMSNNIYSHYNIGLIYYTGDIESKIKVDFKKAYKFFMLSIELKESKRFIGIFIIR